MKFSKKTATLTLVFDADVVAAADEMGLRVPPSPLDVSPPASTAAGSLPPSPSPRPVEVSRHIDIVYPPAPVFPWETPKPPPPSSSAITSQLTADMPPESPERGRDASACTQRHVTFALAPVDAPDPISLPIRRPEDEVDVRGVSFAQNPMLYLAEHGDKGRHLRARRSVPEGALLFEVGRCRLT